MKNVHSEAQMNRKFVEMVKLLNIYLNHWPRHEKYALANRVRDTAYQVYDYIVVSLLGHARRTDSLPAMLALAREEAPHLYRQLPSSTKRLPCN